MRNLFLLLLPILIFCSCTKNDPKPVVPLPPSIASVNPSTGGPETEVTISGSDFSTTLNEDIVEFNGVVAVVTSVTSSLLKVKVPVGAGSGPITVTTPHGTITSASFTYIPDIFIGGTESNGSFYVGKYWKNGVAIPISDGTQNVFINSMVLSGSDVYLPGYESNSTGLSIAKYWKNGVAISLSDGTHNAFSTSMVVVGGDVYVAGYESNGVNTIAKYWKNGVATTLTNGATNAITNSIAVVGNDVYVAGDEAETNGSTVAKYWKNGVATTLTNLPNSLTSAVQITVAGSDVHIVISEWESGNTTSYKYWKNGVTTDITGATQVDHMILVATDVYMAGRQSKIATYWKNGVATPLTDGSNSAFAHAIAVYNNDVYVAGDEFNGTVMVGKYWKNGVATNITNGSFSSAPWGIFVR